MRRRPRAMCSYRGLPERRVAAPSRSSDRPSRAPSDAARPGGPASLPRRRTRPSGESTSPVIRMPRELARASAASGVRQSPPSARANERSAVTAAWVGPWSTTRRSRRSRRSLDDATSASAPWAGAGRNSLNGRARPTSSPRPSRRTPARASAAASSFPARTFAIRLSTLPRSSTTRRSGLHRNNWARRRRLLEPTRAAGGRADAKPGRRTTKQSRGSARRGHATSSRPSASVSGRSFALWTARSTSPRRSARSIASVKSGEPPGARSRSPVVTRGTGSKSIPW